MLENDARVSFAVDFIHLLQSNAILIIHLLAPDLEGTIEIALLA